MSKQEEIDYLNARLAVAQHDLEAQKSLAQPNIAIIKRLVGEISQLTQELQQLGVTATGSTHTQNIIGNARVGTAINGHNYGNIRSQSGGVSYNDNSRHMGDNVTGDKRVVQMGSGNYAEGDYNEFSGDFREAILNIKSTLTETTQTISAATNLQSQQQFQLNTLVQQLDVVLQGVPAMYVAQAKDLAEAVQAVVVQAGKTPTNPKQLAHKIQGLEIAAEELAPHLQELTPITKQLIDLLQ